MDRKPRVLIAEDNPINRTILKKILETEYEVLEAEDGIKAFTMIEENYILLDAVILDLRMPGKNGEEILRELEDKGNYHELPILVATGANDTAIEKECLNLGAWDFISKPYNPEILKLRLRNIIGRKESTLLQRIKTMAEKDNLTGLYNRTFFMEQAQKLIQTNPDVSFALVRMDIDRFRLYNATFGKESGDELLKCFAQMLNSKLSNNPLVVYGRIESDVFCVCLPFEKESLIRNIEESVGWARKMCDNYRLELSFGIYSLFKPHQNLEEAYSYATEAAKKCKDSFTLAYAFYDEDMVAKQMREQEIVNDMEKAIEEEQFKVYLQPKYSLSTSMPCGAEALVRWIHPEKGMISPAEFIPTFEKNGFINQLDCYMWRQTCKLLHSWKVRGLQVNPVSVNISRISMYNPNVVHTLKGLVEEYHLEPNLLNLEITESAYMSNPELMKVLISQLHSEGFVMLMDDFGSGYSSLNTLKDIEMDILKIDMKFLPSGHENVKSEKILASVNRMASWLGMPVIVEGVETKEQVDFLVSIGCDYAQGYYFAKPMPVSEYEKLLAEQSPHEEKKEETTTFTLADLDDLWSADPKIGTILKSISVPFAILEYSFIGLESLRVNAEYLKHFGENDCKLNMLTPESRKKIESCIVEAVSTHHQKDVDCLCVVADGQFRWYSIHLQLIKAIGKSSLFGATFTDITAQKQMETEMNRIFSAMKSKEKDKKGILIVDDSDISIDILKGIFENKYTVFTAYNGKEALEILQESSNEISLILLDMNMPVMNGQEFLAQKNANSLIADLPVIVISSNQSENSQMNMLRFGVNDYITKPFFSAMVLKRVQNVLDYQSRFRDLLKEYTEE